MKTKSNLKQKWSMFFNIILSPGSFIFFLATLLILCLSIIILIIFENQLLSSFLAVLASVSAAVAGTFLKDDWDKMQESSLLVKKGRSAIRNLESIEKQIIQIKKWIRSFLKNKTAKRDLEEIDRHLGTAEMNIASGVSDWIDVIPELKEKENEIKNYQEVVKAYVYEILENKRELIKAGKDKKLKKQLGKRIKDLEAEVEELKENQPYLTKISSRAFVNNDFAASPYSINLRSLDIGDKICSKCGKKYKDDLLLNSSLKTVTAVNLCSDCRE